MRCFAYFVYDNTPDSFYSPFLFIIWNSFNSLSGLSIKFELWIHFVLHYQCFLNELTIKLLAVEYFTGRKETNEQNVLLKYGWLPMQYSQSKMA